MEAAYAGSIVRTYLSDIERGTRNVSLIDVERVATALSLRISELFQAVER
ncbi:MAG: helix-turn-helix domain-containing protein [Singulisphaera sp.]